MWTKRFFFLYFISIFFFFKHDVCTLSIIRQILAPSSFFRKQGPPFYPILPLLPVLIFILSIFYLNFTLISHTKSVYERVNIAHVDGSVKYSVQKWFVRLFKYLKDSRSWTFCSLFYSV